MTNTKVCAAIGRSSAGFGYDTLETLAKTLECADGSLRHILILPAGQTIPPPPKKGELRIRLAHKELQWSSFGDARIAARLPPRGLWPDTEPATAIMVRRISREPRNLVQPDRVHLLFGDTTRINALRSLANELFDHAKTIENEIRRSSNGKSGPERDVFCRNPECHEGRNARAIDSWLCTIHYWAWQDRTPIPVNTFVAISDEPQRVDPLDAVFESRDSYSRLEPDVFRASLETIQFVLGLYRMPSRRSVKDGNSGTAKDRVLPQRTLAKEDASEQTVSDLPAHIEQAYRAYELGQNQLGERDSGRITVKMVYQWLSENVVEDYKVPSKVDTFARYVREARRLSEGPKQTARTGRSVFRKSEL